MVNYGSDDDDSNIDGDVISDDGSDAVTAVVDKIDNKQLNQYKLIHSKTNGKQVTVTFE